MACNRTRRRRQAPPRSPGGRVDAVRVRLRQLVGDRAQPPRLILIGRCDLVRAVVRVASDLPLEPTTRHRIQPEPVLEQTNLAEARGRPARRAPHDPPAPPAASAPARRPRGTSPRSATTRPSPTTPASKVTSSPRPRAAASDPPAATAAPRAVRPAPEPCYASDADLAVSARAPSVTRWGMRTNSEMTSRVIAARGRLQSKQVPPLGHASTKSSGCSRTSGSLSTTIVPLKMSAMRPLRRATTSRLRRSRCGGSILILFCFACSSSRSRRSRSAAACSASSVAKSRVELRPACRVP